jgi:quinol monooxygenase YgiN
MESMMTVKVIAFVPVKPGSEEAFEAAAAHCVCASRSEPGVLHYDLWRENGGQRRYVFNELYTDQSAVDAHMQSDHFKAFGAAARDLAAARPEIIATSAVNVAD